MDIDNLESRLTHIEQEAEQSLQNREQLENRAAQLETALTRLQEDLELSQLMNQRLQEAGQENQNLQQQLENYAQQVSLLENELQQMMDQLSESAEVLLQLSQLGEDVEAGVALLEERQKLIEHCTEHLQEVMRRLGLEMSARSNPEASLGFRKTMSPADVTNMWKRELQSIDVQIENYRQALKDRGVPDGAWLSRTLADHRAGMMEQAGYELDRASGKGDISVNNPNAYRYPGDYKAFYDELAEQFFTHCLKDTNPHYSEAACWQDNCQRCVPAYEMLRRGDEITVAPSTKGSKHLAYHPFDVWEKPEVKNAAGNGQADIEAAMKQWGDGARAQVVVLWDGPFGGGHTFLAEQRNGETVFFDPQNGSACVTDYFQRARLGGTQFCRIDNLNFSSYAKDCYQED